MPLYHSAMPVEEAETQTKIAGRGNSRPYLSLGITFLLLGIGFADPLPLFARFPRGLWEGQISAEALNLYALTAYLGWAHFAYAWRGQARAVQRMEPRFRVGYWMAVGVILAALLVLRTAIGVSIFSVAIWVYNISHFIKAETVFSDRGRSPLFYMPTVAFAWFTLALFAVGPLANRLVVFGGTLLLAAIALLAENLRDLSEGRLLLPLLTFFLLGETLVWSGYSPYMSPAFRVGVYVFHVAGASFFHYFGSYSFAQRGSATPRWLRPGAILAVNAGFLIAGCAAERFSALAPLRYVLSPEWFTLWVALHLAASDLLPLWKRQSQRVAVPLS